MTREKTPACALLTACLLAAGCDDGAPVTRDVGNGGDGGSNVDGAPVADGGSATIADGGSATIADGGLETACEEWAAAMCGSWTRCFPALFTSIYGSVAVCTLRTASKCVFDTNAPGSLLSEAALVTCAQDLAISIGCSDVFFNHLTAACTPRPGQAPGGASCASNAQCQTGYCHIAPGSTCGTCGAPADGSPCSPEWIGCGPGVACFEGVCYAPRTAGAACATVCGPGLACTSGKCVASGAGSACMASSDCDPTIFSYCGDPQATGTNTCQTGAIVGLPPNNCGPAAPCVGGATCADGGACVPPALDGQPCGGDTRCVEPAVCAAVNGGGATCIGPGAESCP